MNGYTHTHTSKSNRIMYKPIEQSVINRDAGSKHKKAVAVDTNNGNPVKRMSIVEPQWMVISRHTGTMGGISDYGYAYIEEFFDTPAKADAYAQKILNELEETQDPHVWVLKCETTYLKDGVIKSAPLLDKKGR